MPGKTQILETGRDVTLLLDADNATLRAGNDELAGHVEVASGRHVTGRLWADPGSAETHARLFSGGGVLELCNQVGDARVVLRGGIGAVQGRILRADDDDGHAGVRLDGPNATLTIGGEHSAKLDMIDSRGLPFVQVANHWMKLGTPAAQLGDAVPGQGHGSAVMMYDSSGEEAIHLSTWGSKLLLGKEGNHHQIELDGSKATLGIGCDSNSPSTFDRHSVQLNGKDATLVLGRKDLAGTMVLRDNDHNIAIAIDGARAALTLGVKGREGDLIVMDAEGREVGHIDGSKAEFRLGASGAASSLRFHDDGGREVLRFADATLRVGTDGNAGGFLVRDGAGRAVVSVDSGAAQLNVGVSGRAGEINVRDASGNNTIQLDGDSGDILLSNADCAEEFDFVTDSVEPGTVVVIGDDERLSVCAEAYDRRVAGVVSGAGRYRPAIVLDRRAGQTRPAVAMIGKVECKVDACYGPIHCGDLLVSSPTPGHAMVGADRDLTSGAVLGKALRGLDEGTGLIPILVCLQ